MADQDDTDFVTAIVERSERAVCKRVGTLQNDFTRVTQDFKRKLKEQEEKMEQLSAENRSLKEQLDNFRGEIRGECSRQCCEVFQQAMSSAYNSVMNSSFLVSADTLTNQNIEYVAQQQNSNLPSGTETTPLPVLNLSPVDLDTRDQPATSSAKRKLACETSQLITNFDNLDQGIREKIMEFNKLSKYATADKLNPVQRAFVKYHTFIIVNEKKKINDALVNEILDEGVEYRIWNSAFKPARDMSLHQYLCCRFRNEKKRQTRVNKLNDTDERINSYIQEESSIVGDDAASEL